MNIKTWHERMPAPRVEYQCSMNCSPRNPPCGDCAPVKVYGDPIAARDAEIAELRAALAGQLSGRAAAAVMAETMDHAQLQALGRQQREP